MIQRLDEDKAEKAKDREERDSNQKAIIDLIGNRETNTLNKVSELIKINSSGLALAFAKIKSTKQRNPKVIETIISDCVKSVKEANEKALASNNQQPKLSEISGFDRKLNKYIINNEEKLLLKKDSNKKIFKT